MFTWLNKQGVRSESGFVVQFTDRFSAEYREGGRIITVFVQDGISGGMPAIIVGPDAFAHWDDDTAPFSETERKRLFENFRLACEFQGLKMVVE